ncbi:hypothetical protein DYU05_20070 [Mucilaginibacter terrenus]|uniref:Novel STAND NTPase 5 domain-containing protein n=1 Tax=Mucilaginibacter terrenus TaxID=2482727 RepID=A0A3E2NK15_9SPHI|nr:SIR2 family protein [Mucilaginibacter terrenus]RFZ81281.1 hypothetical protein DYU05_20070 [Mucilaginibacter terrenus]
MSEKLLPQILVDQIRNKNVVLFLGSGFAYNSVHPQGRKAPLGQALSDDIARKFLGNDYVGNPLTYNSDLAISASSLFDVQRFIYDIFEPFAPNEKQVAFSNFSWKSIFTTNYDLLLEKAYDKNREAAQSLSVVYRNTREQDIFKNQNSVPYYKLHGTITYINDEQLPLILSTEQYITHLKNRERLFSKLRELAQDYIFLFIGYSNQDWNIRSILKEIESLKDGRPRSYMVGPKFSDVEIGYWNERKISPIPIGYEEFIDKLLLQIPEIERKLSTYIPNFDKPIYRKFAIDLSGYKPSESLVKLIDQEIEFVHSSMQSVNTTPEAFYKGYFENWDPIIKNLDINRTLKDRVLEDMIFNKHYQSETTQHLFCIKGYAGSGKSVLLKRIAWESSVTFEKFCIYLKPNANIRYEPFIELYNCIKERIYLFVDNAIEYENSILLLIDKLEKEKIPITIVSTAKINLLNESEIQSYIDQEYTLTYLSEKEIEELIKKLFIHKSLGYLTNKNIEEQKALLSERSGRVLLVALHEATSGKPFEEIIFNEFIGIPNQSAKSLYLTVAILHRLGTYARAGLISRVHNIGFEEFKSKFFKPLEYIVFDERNYTINDYIYKTRHPLIAQMVFETVLVDEQSRYDEYIRIFSYLDIDYNSDRVAFLAMTKAKQLIPLFNDPIRLRNLYDAAELCSPDDAKLLQQRAIMEMSIPGGIPAKVEAFLKRALELMPNDPMISHSLAEYTLKQAEKSSNKLERNTLVNSAINLCHKILKKSNSHHSHHTIIKAKMLLLKDAIESNTAPAVESLIKEIEKTLQIAKQSFPEQEFIIDIEARFKELIDNQPRALELLKQAYEINKASPYISLRFAKTLENKGELEEAIKVLDQTIALNPNDKDVSFRLALLLSLRPNPDYGEIIHYFRRSFISGDNRYEAQFWYARALFINNDIQKAEIEFERLSRTKVNIEFKRNPRGVVDSKESVRQYKGSITVLEANYAFVKREAFGDDIFVYRHTTKIDWTDLKVGSRISFSIMFNYRGPVAVDVYMN